MAMTLDGTSGITQMTGSIVMSGSTSGTTTIIPSAVAGTTTVTMPAATGTMMVSGNMPAFSYYQSSAQTLTGGVTTKLTFTTSEFDTTSGMYASSRFTPTIAGYYQASGGLQMGASATVITLYLYKNGSNYKQLFSSNSSNVSGAYGSALVYLNGSTDYIELYANISTGQSLNATSANVYFQATMVRGA